MKEIVCTKNARGPLCDMTDIVHYLELWFFFLFKCLQMLNGNECTVSGITREEHFLQKCFMIFHTKRIGLLIVV